MYHNDKFKELSNLICLSVLVRAKEKKLREKMIVHLTVV